MLSPGLVTHLYPELGTSISKITHPLSYLQDLKIPPLSSVNFSRLNPAFWAMLALYIYGFSEVGVDLLSYHHEQKIFQVCSQERECQSKTPIRMIWSERIVERKRKKARSLSSLMLDATPNYSATYQFFSIAYSCRANGTTDSSRVLKFIPSTCCALDESQE